MMKFVSLALCAFIAANYAHATQIPQPGKEDPRIRYVTYNKDDVVQIPVQRGTATRIVLGPSEKIMPDGAASGFPADCSKPDLEWCIHADPGTNQVMVKPRDAATHNNLELRTDRHDYSFAFRVLPDVAPDDGKPKARQARTSAAYRIMFRYPSETVGNGLSVRAAAEQSLLDDRLAAARPLPRNWKYAMQVMKGSDDIRPAIAFDDGRFTYFKFPANREIPTIYAVSPKGEESRVNFHVDEADDTLMVVERTGRQFVLRLGSATVGVWNEAFDPDGIAPRDGTTVTGVSRVLRDEK